MPSRRDRWSCARCSRLIRLIAIQEVETRLGKRVDRGWERLLLDHDVEIVVDPEIGALVDGLGQDRALHEQPGCRARRGPHRVTAGRRAPEGGGRSGGGSNRSELPGGRTLTVRVSPSATGGPCSSRGDSEPRRRDDGGAGIDHASQGGVALARRPSRSGLEPTAPRSRSVTDTSRVLGVLPSAGWWPDIDPVDLDPRVRVLGGGRRGSPIPELGLSVAASQDVVQDERGDQAAEVGDVAPVSAF